MEIEKERLSNNRLLPKWIWLEHNARYDFASQFTEGKIMVDCACGTGVGTKLFSEKAAAIFSFDVSENAVKEAMESNTKDIITFQVASGTNLPLKNSFADLYISLETIEHIQDDNKFLKEVYRVLKKGGLFVCSTPNRNVTNPGKKITDKPANSFHIREYNTTEYIKVLNKYFTNVEIFGQNPNMLLKTKILNILGIFLPFNLATRLHQLLKLIFSFSGKNNYYRVQPINDNYTYEYIIAVCQK